MSVGPGDSEIYSKHAEDLTRFATGLVGPSDAADVVSEAVLSCFNSKQGQRVAEKRSYLYRSVGPPSAISWRWQECNAHRKPHSQLNPRGIATLAG